jgi:hypothetical protein
VFVDPDDLVETVEHILAARLAAHPPATDRDTALELMALGRRAQNDPGQFVKRIYPDDYGDYERLDRWQARAVDAAVDSWLAARPAPDTLADRVQALDDPAARHYAAFVGAEAERVRLAHAIEALADEWDDYEWTAPCATEREKGEAAGREKATWARADDLRALLAGRPDASPEGGEQRG